MTIWMRGGLICGGLAVALLTSSVAQGSVTTITLDVSPSTPTSGNWLAGDLVGITVRASSDGAAGQGFSGADFKTGVLGIFVDTDYVKIHDILFNSTLQVDTEEHATAYDGTFGYSKASDTWVYDDFTDFAGEAVLMADGSFKAIASAQTASGYDLGRASPVDYLHLVFEIQPGFGAGESTAVTFTGQVGAYNTAQEDTASRIFDGDVGSDVNTGSFTLTVPEPTTVALLLAGLASLVARRPRR